MRSSDEEKGKDLQLCWDGEWDLVPKWVGWPLLGTQWKEKKAEHSGKHASWAWCGGGNSQKFSSDCLYSLSQRGSKFIGEGDEKGLGGLVREETVQTSWRGETWIEEGYWVLFLGSLKSQLIMNLGRYRSTGMWPSSAYRHRCRNRELAYPGLRMCWANMTDIYWIQLNWMKLIAHRHIDFRGQFSLVLTCLVPPGFCHLQGEIHKIQDSEILTALQICVLKNQTMLFASYLWPAIEQAIN